MKFYKLLPIAILMMSVSVINAQPKFNASNPFFTASKLPYHAPDFRRIKDQHFEPAIKEGMRIQLLEIKKIAYNTHAPTFENTLIALEKSGRLLDRVTNVFNLLTGANSNPALDKIQQLLAPQQAAHKDAIFLNDKLFKRIKAIYTKRNSLKLDSESLRLVEYYYQKFELSGANLSSVDKASLKKLNEEEATLAAKFTSQLLAAAKKGALVVDNVSELAGLSQGEIDAAANDAKAAGYANKWLLSLQNTTQQPALQLLSNRATREKLFKASWNRAENNDSNDTRATIGQIARIHAEKAKLVGFPDYATWKLQDQMAVSSKPVSDFFQQLVAPATSKVKAEAADIQAVIDKEKGGFKLEPWDWNYYAEKVRKEKYDLDESEVKPYFELNTVFEKGVLYAANQLYGLTFKERFDLPVYHKDVRVFQVYDKDNSTIGLFYGDFYKRDNKSGGAWMDNIVIQSKLLGTKPVIYNVCNFPKPAPGQPALISFRDVTTMFHEFGHALHGFFGSQKYPAISGANTARDFVEFPSQFNEHWAFDPKVLKNYALHYKTKQQIPESLLAKIKKAATFNGGYNLTEALSAAMLDMEWNTITAGTEIPNVNQFEGQALKLSKLDLSEVPPRYRSTYFLHIWSNGYAAGYYAYLWTDMLEEDAYSWFKENGGMTRANGQRFRDMILSKGNTEPYGKMFRAFRGRDPEIGPMLESRGVSSEKAY